jgi:hypothetical protein
MRKVRWDRYPPCPKCFREYACWGRSGPMKRPHRERTRLGPRIGNRILLAASCLGCGKFIQGNRFDCRPRRRLDIRSYYDLRCGSCKWGAKVKA